MENTVATMTIFNQIINSIKQVLIGMEFIKDPEDRTPTQTNGWW